MRPATAAIAEALSGVPSTVTCGAGAGGRPRVTGADLDLDAHVELGGGVLDGLLQPGGVVGDGHQHPEDQAAAQPDLLQVDDLDARTGQGGEHRGRHAGPVAPGQGDQERLGAGGGGRGEVAGSSQARGYRHRSALSTRPRAGESSGTGAGASAMRSAEPMATFARPDLCPDCGAGAAHRPGLLPPLRAAAAAPVGRRAARDPAPCRRPAGPAQGHRGGAGVHRCPGPRPGADGPRTEPVRRGEVSRRRPCRGCC